MNNLTTLMRAFRPVIQGELPQTTEVVVGGMGGSALPALILKDLHARALTIHRDYGLPARAPTDALYVAISYSGNTEETLSFFDTAYNRGHALAVITTGGTLLDKALSLQVPYILIPKLELEPRDALGLLTKALAALLQEEEVLHALDREVHVPEDAVQSLADALQDRIALVYGSLHTEAAAYIAKILLNETAKVPAFFNLFPEVNHNEMQGIDPLGPTDLAKDLVPLLLIGRDDHPRVRARMELFRTLMDERGLETHALLLPGGRLESTLYVWHLFSRAAGVLARAYKVEPAPTPLIAEFKKRL